MDCGNLDNKVCPAKTANIKKKDSYPIDTPIPIVPIIFPSSVPVS